jgi:hypothetical protein
MNRSVRGRLALVVATGAAIEITMVVAGMGPRLLGVTAMIVVVACTAALAFDVDRIVASTHWPARQTPTRRTSSGEWRVSTLRMWLVQARRDDGSSTQLFETLVGLVDDRLMSEHRIDRAADPAAAAAVLGPLLERFVSSPGPPRRLSEPRILGPIIGLIENL